MDNREHFIATLQACYFGDRNAFNEIVRIYDDMEQRINKAIDDIDLVIDLIKQQPTEDDTWILNRLNGFKYILKGGDTNDNK